MTNVHTICNLLCQQDTPDNFLASSIPRKNPRVPVSARPLETRFSNDQHNDRVVLSAADARFQFISHRINIFYIRVTTVSGR
jgi:hypothetical protein